jgi:amidase
VAAGGSPLEVGTDTGGSIRLPAHFCGVAGLKPTAGRVPRTGHVIDYVGASQFLTHVGPIARHVSDLALALGILAGPDGVDPYVPPVPLRDPEAVEVARLRIAWFTRLPPLEPTPETAAAVETAVETLARAGCRTRPLEPIPDSERLYDQYMNVLYGDGGRAVSRILERWGTKESLLDERLRTSPALPSGDLTALFEWVDRWKSRMLALVADHDAVVCPVNVAPAPRHGTFERASAAYTQLFNVTGWPAAVVRAGTSPEGLPLGVQVAAHPWREDVSLAAAGYLEKALGPFPGPRVGDA